MPLRLLIVDPQPLFCQTLAFGLGRDPRLDVVGWTTDERRASRLAETTRADVVLTELELAPGSGISLARRLRDRTRVVMLTRRHEGEVLLDVVSAGAVGCLGHAIGIDELARLLHETARDRFLVDPARLLEALRSAAERAIGGGPRSVLAQLTPREREVLQLLAAGLDNRGIAEALYLSPDTARTHVRNVLRKLGVHSRAEAVRLAIRTGFAHPEVRIMRIQGPDLRAR
ncbi:MAG: LuxR C-terminal-related transcriptional regulator [Actinomycetota bacterium]